MLTSARGEIKVDNKAMNDICFSQPHWRLIAGGFDIERWFNDGQGIGNGGILFPGREHLKVTNYYYRFANSISREAQLGSGWWISYDTFNTIRQFAEMNQYELTYAARLFLALPYEWSRLDRLVRAQLIKPMDAYVGEGKVAETEKDKWIPNQTEKVRQIYIPGLFISPNNTKNLCGIVWSDISINYIPTGSLSELKKA